MLDFVFIGLYVWFISIFLLGFLRLLDLILPYKDKGFPSKSMCSYLPSPGPDPPAQRLWVKTEGRNPPPGDRPTPPPPPMPRSKVPESHYAPYC